MDGTIRAEKDFVGYEYRDITVHQDMEAIYADSYENFGWKLESVTTPPFGGIHSTTLKFKRDRKIRNKAELTRLQRQFDACANEVKRMEQSTTTKASIVAYTIGLLGTACMAGATFAYLGNAMVLCVMLAIPGFLGWILPYFAYNSTSAKKTAEIAPLVEGKYDEIYAVCEKANSLL